MLRPEEVLTFTTLYKQNCAACHGEDGKNGAALPLANPVYLAVAEEDNIRHIIANGVPGKLMPPFAKNAGGMLTDQQVFALAQGVVRRWGTPNLLAGKNPPPYIATQPGDSTRGQQTFTTFCARCHGAIGEGAPDDPKTGVRKLGSIVDPSYLALISDQDLRIIIIAGLPDRGMPDWRTDSAVRPLTDQQITDIVSWLASQHVVNPGQPYPTLKTKTSAGATQ
ncbi:c-type cytochrome [Granulicella arctica]|uniref:Cytochrome c oxidase cbb3-type subunit 3/ubiquinol-cytochrome c reductase cytochrome c subunit n=1 Tax=Granulicella arctica TaxID=940613 RepID=A0A7Y9PHU5_9BACT|nr:cytochrome c oxidase cbb3-type subunit 3/ubiquinol-cytochrome c reductase cytochrome c subunit [Granulicella arctica]